MCCQEDSLKQEGKDTEGNKIDFLPMKNPAIDVRPMDTPSVHKHLLIFSDVKIMHAVISRIMYLQVIHVNNFFNDCQPKAI